MNILVATEHIAMRMQIRQLLRPIDCSIYEANSARQVKENNFDKQYSLRDMDLILYELGTDFSEGYELIDFINTHYQDISLIVMSNPKKIEIIFKCIQLGARDYIIDPLDGENLISKVKSFCESITSQKLNKEINILSNALLLEIERAIRSQSSFSVLAMRVNEREQLIGREIRDVLIESLRIIDNVFTVKNAFVLILPLADKPGSKIVKFKLLEKILKEGISYKDVRADSFVFPDDVDNKELLSHYKSSEIKDFINKKLKLW